MVCLLVTPSCKMGRWYFVLSLASCLCYFQLSRVCQESYHVSDFLSTCCYYLCCWRLFTVVYLKGWELFCDYVVNERGCSTRIPRWALLGDLPVLLVSLAMFELMPSQVCRGPNTNVLLFLQVNSAFHLLLIIWHIKNERSLFFATLNILVSLCAAIVFLRSMCIV